MKIMQIIPKFGYGGAETMCQNLSIELHKNGYDVLIVSLYNFHSPISEKIENNGIKIVYLNKYNGFDIKAIFQLRKIIKSYSPDVIHSHLYAIKYMVLSDLFLGHRKIHTLHSIAQKESGKLGRFLNYFFFRINKVIPVALSENVKKTILEVYKLKNIKVPVILNGVPLENCVSKNDYNFLNKITIMHTGSVIPLKNHAEMIKAIENLHHIDPRINILFIGDGPLRENYQKQIYEKNEDGFISFYGLSDNVYELLNKADIFLFPSIYEGIPMSIIEAMGTGLPVVASDVGGIPDMIEDGKNGLLCQPNAASIKEKLTLLIDNYELRKKIGENALNSSVKFSVEIMANQYLKIYKD